MLQLSFGEKESFGVVDSTLWKGYSSHIMKCPVHTVEKS